MDVDFINEEKQQNNLYNRPSEETGLIGFLMRKGIVKSRKQADMFLITLAVVCLAVSVVLVFAYIVPPKKEATVSPLIKIREAQNAQIPR